MTEPSIVVLTNERDFAADDVVRRLHDRGVRVRRLNIEAARSKAVGTWSPQPKDPPDVPAVVWWRQFEVDERPQGLADVDDVLVERAQWRVWVATLSSTGTIWVNDLWAARKAENKVEQLRTAQRVGFTIPSTTVTNDPSEARVFQERIGRCVVKTLASAYFSFSDQSFVFTELLDDTTDDGWYRVPVVVQKMISDGVDARVVSFGSKSFAARCLSRGVDWRKTPFDPNLWQPWSLPAEVEDACVAYRDRLGLEYAAFDFMIAPDGEVLFLEANQAGEWMFLDRSLDLGISAALADRLLELAVRGTR